MSADDTVTSILQTAHESVAAAKVPDEFRLAAFDKAVDMLASKRGIAAAPVPLVDPPPEDQSQRGDGDTSRGLAEPKTLAQIARSLKLGEEVVGEVFYVDGDSLALGIGTSQLESAKKAGAKQIALLVAAGRQAGGWDHEWTAVAEIRPIADAYGRSSISWATAADLNQPLSLRPSTYPSGEARRVSRGGAGEGKARYCARLRA